MLNLIDGAALCVTAPAPQYLRLLAALSLLQCHYPLAHYTSKVYCVTIKDARGARSRIRVYSRCASDVIFSSFSPSNVIYSRVDPKFPRDNISPKCSDTNWRKA
jgi:hypothetical protein